MITLSDSWQVLRKAGSDWREDRADLQGAALAFYSLLSIAPLLIISLTIASYVLDRNMARQAIVQEMQGLVGSEGGQAVESMLAEKDEQKGRGTLSTILGIATLLFGASGVFGQLQDALNTIW